MFKETKMVKLIPIKRKNQARRNLRQKNLRKKPLEKRNRKARNQSLQNQQRNQKKESEEPQVETEKVEEKLREAEDLLGKIQDPIIKSNAKETLTGLKNNLLFGTQDNNTIMAEAEKLLALLKESK